MEEKRMISKWTLLVLTLVIGCAFVMSCGDEDGDETESLDLTLVGCHEQAEDFETAVVAFPYDVKVDGKLDEEFWSSEIIKWNKVPYTAGDYGEEHDTFPASSDEDISFEFAAVANSEFLFIAVKVTDEVVHSDFEESVHLDDSVELFIDSGAEHNDSQDNSVMAEWADPGYDNNDAQFQVDMNGGVHGCWQNPDIDATAEGFPIEGSAIVKTDTGYVQEIKIPMNWPNTPIILEHGTVIGLNVAVNDDDQEVDVNEETGFIPRSHQISWAKKAQTSPDSWVNPSLWSEAYFCDTERENLE